MIGGHRIAGLAALAVATGLTACSVDLVDAEKSPSTPRSSTAAYPSPSKPSPSKPSPSKLSSPNSPRAATPSVTSSGLPTAAELRARFADDVVKQLDCSGGSVTITGAGTVAELTQPCDRVTVDGSGIVLFAQRIGSLEVDAASSVVLATSISSVKTVGAGVEVYWTSGQPKVSDSGAGTVARRIEAK